ncbi:MAG: hypothetical protein RSE09_02180 [Oscillospiraceae bacterium]
MIKKMHSVLSLLLCAVLMAHMVATGLLMAHIVNMRLWFIILSYMLLFILIAHLLLTFIPMLLNHADNKQKAYTRLNLRCYLQRMSGLVIVALMHPHFSAFVKPDAIANTPWNVKLSMAFANPGMEIIDPVPVTMKSLFALIAMIALVLFCCVHITISIPKALVGLGVIVEEKTLARVEKICLVLAFAVGAFAIFGACSLASFSGLFGGAL